MRSGAYKGPYDRKSSRVKPLPPNREARIGAKLKNLFFYQVGFDIADITSARKNAFAKFISMQEEAERRN